MARSAGIGTRLNFFVDEIGQFIGQDTKLMLSLQTIAESLFTKCGGRAWVLVTSQRSWTRSLVTVPRNSSRTSRRFRPASPFSSSWIPERARGGVQAVAGKTTDGAGLLTGVYEKNADRFRSLFAFQDQRTYRNYTTADDFVDTYPFVDYQFELFHDAMRGLSDFNAFTGRHSSVGNGRCSVSPRTSGRSSRPGMSVHWPLSTCSTTASRIRCTHR